MSDAVTHLVEPHAQAAGLGALAAVPDDGAPAGGHGTTVPPGLGLAPQVGSGAPAGLTGRDEQILAFERKWWKYAGAKEQAIRELFGMTATRYYQALNALIDTPEALAYDPMLVKRLRRLRTTRHRARSVRRLDDQ